MPFSQRDRSTSLTEVALVIVGGYRLLWLDSFKRLSGQHHLTFHSDRTNLEPEMKDPIGALLKTLYSTFGTAFLSLLQSISVPQPTFGSSLLSPSPFFAIPSQMRHLYHPDLILLLHRHTHRPDLALPVSVVVSLLVLIVFCQSHHLPHRTQIAPSATPSAFCAILVY